VPLVPLRDQVLFPGVTLPLYFSRPSARRAIESALKSKRPVLATLQKNPIEDRPRPSGMYPVGTLARVLQAIDGEDRGIRVVLRGEARARWERAEDQGGWHLAEANLIKPARRRSGPDPAALARLRSLYSNYVKLEPRHAAGLAAEAKSIREPALLLEHISAHMLLPPSKRQGILEAIDPGEQARCLESCLRDEIRRLTPSSFKRDLLVEDEASAGRTTPGASDYLDLIQGSELPPAVLARAREEAGRLQQMPPLSPEGVVVRTYLDWLLALPWKKKTRDKTDIARARRVLDEDHAGLEAVKERIIEAIAVIHRTRRLPPTTLAFIGPPGVGKTSLGQSIARTLGRKFARISLGGIRDEAEIRGHRRTYVGSLPGRIVQAMRRTGTVNPVIMLDEVDKLGSDFRGNPAAALLEVLDPEQNNSFSDNYLEVEYDLRRVLFLVTANSHAGIPPALRDRLEILPLPGYHEDEKIRIAREHLIPKMERLHGLGAGDLSLSDEELKFLIRRYTHEAGVRNAERVLARLCRRAILTKLEGAAKGGSGAGDRLGRDLGPPPFPGAGTSLAGEVGRALGMGVTDVGGEILPVEVMILPGRGRKIITGGAGAVLKDSIRAAFTRARADGLVNPSDRQRDIHVHLPRGGIAKDGPSAGGAIYLALVSALLAIPVADRLAVTGEITLRGRILPVGGLREKILAAWREGIQTVLFPADQRAEIEALPDGAREALHCLPVSSATQIREYGLRRSMLEPGEAQRPAA
jgi:ATP-dependent Lon protease